MKVASIIEYDGSKYHGFQYQMELSTIQGELENSIEKLTGEKVRVSGAGRTDARGVVPIHRVVRGANYSSPVKRDLTGYTGCRQI